MADIVPVIAASTVGVVFLVAAVGKWSAPSQWSRQAGDMGVPAFVAAAVPVVEAIVGAWLLVQWQRSAAAIVSVVVVLAFTVLLVVQLARGRRPVCACFGAWSTRPIGPMTVLRNLVVAGLALLAVV